MKLHFRKAWVALLGKPNQQMAERQPKLVAIYAFRYGAQLAPDQFGDNKAAQGS